MLGLRTTIYKVTDIAKAKQWYTKAFETSPYFDEVFYVGFNIGGYELGLIPDETLAIEKRDGGILTYWGVNNIEYDFERLINLGAFAHELPHNVGGEIMVGSVKDPWGNVIGIIYNPEFKLKS
jgi:predicted enzyme related to lactoylglutathione lyase